MGADVDGVIAEQARGAGRAGDGAADLVQPLTSAAPALSERPDGAWRPPIFATIAAQSQGLDEVVAEIDRHFSWLTESGELARRRTRRARDEIEAIAVAALRAQWGDVHGRSDLDTLAESVASGESDPYTAADVLLSTEQSD